MSQLFTHRQTHAPTPLLFHSPTLTSPNAVRSTRNENKRLEFRVWHQIEFSSHRPPTPSVSASSFFVFVFPHHSLTDLFSPSNQKQKKKKKPGRRTHFLPLKNKLNGKKKKTTQVFFVFLFYVFIYIYLFFKFKAQCLSVFQSVFTPRFSVRTWRHMSRTVCSYSFTSLLCAL